MLNLRKIAITGGVAVGKSTVGQIFRELGAYVVDADAIVHELLNPDTNLGRNVIKAFGTLNRTQLAEKVFDNPVALAQLESLLHPAVLKRIDELYAQVKREGKHELFLVEIPLLYEIGAQDQFDATIVVVAPDELARKRYIQKGHSAWDYNRRMNRQLNPALKAASATITVENIGTIEDIRTAVTAIIPKLKTQAAT